jgi:hypothetical protein
MLLGALVVIFCLTGYGACVTNAAAANRATKKEGNTHPQGELDQAGVEKTGNEEAVPKTDVEIIETGGLALSELTLSKGIEDRKPVESGTVFKLGEYDRIYAFLNVKNPASTEEEVTVSFAPEGGSERGTVTVRIGPQKKWRTWAFSKVVRKVGTWQVIVRNRNGDLLGRAQFEVVDGDEEHR